MQKNCTTTTSEIKEKTRILIRYVIERMAR